MKQDSLSDSPSRPAMAEPRRLSGRRHLQAERWSARRSLAFLVLLSLLGWALIVWVI